MAAQFEVYEDSKGTFRWHLKAANGEVIASCPIDRPYRSRDAAKLGIKSVQTDALVAEVVDTAKPTVPKKPSGETAERITPAEQKRRRDEVNRKGKEHRVIPK
jgi:uncharacterized protein YegP (UPF0339 family)